MPDDYFSAMRQNIIEGAPDTASGLAKEALASGVPPIDAIDDGFVPGMHDVGQQFARGQMFLPDMMASAEAMRAAMAVLDAELKRLGTERPRTGIVVLGTTKGDIHEIGKILVGTMLTGHGFQVHDLGVDVAGEKFAAKARELKADIVGVSALLTTTMGNQKSVGRGVGKRGAAPASKSDGRRRTGHPSLGRRNRRRRLRQRRHERSHAGARVDAAEVANRVVETLLATVSAASATGSRIHEHCQQRRSNLRLYRNCTCDPNSNSSTSR
jgi:methanogenic corrinoid protein MtbC1